MLSRTLLIFSILLSSSAWAQMWGTGMYGGMQGCSYPTQVAQGAVSEDDATLEARERIKEIQEELKNKKSEKKKVDAQVKRSRSAIEKSISGEYSDFIFEHIENSRRCAQYKGHPTAQGEGVEAGGEEGGREIADGNMLEVQSFSKEQWSRFCDATKPGSVSASVCTEPQVQGRSGERNSQTCKQGLTEYRKNYGLAEKIQGEIEDLQEDLKIAKSELSDARKDAAAERKEQTEGGVCLECMAKSNGQNAVQPQTNWASVLGNVGVGLASMYAGYQTNKMISENNANLGWPTDPYASQGYGYGLGAIGTGLGQVVGGGSGIYGSMAGGMGSGSFGCAGLNGGMNGMMGPYGGTNGYGMWGNPYGMSMYGNNMQGGGMFNSGMGPWGMNGYNYMQNPQQYQQQYQQQMQKYQAMSSLQQEMNTLMYRMQQIQYGNSSYYGGYLGYSNSAYGYNSGLSVIPGSYYSSNLGTNLSTVPSTTTSTSYLLGR